MSFTQKYLSEVLTITASLDWNSVEKSVEILVRTKALGGRLFILGVGGSAANASHAVNDFRKICGIEAYAPTDNVAELTARINDNGWNSVFADWLAASRLSSKDTLLIFSVGGGTPLASVNLIWAMDYAKKIGPRIIGIVGRDGGATAKLADALVIIPTINSEHVTPHTESFQVVLFHLIVNHPSLRK
jgi:D-sedoheptulose 7-phosphate isomerase